jgi:hypothetical protein
MSPKIELFAATAVITSDTTTFTWNPEGKGYVALMEV